ncbi:MAG: carbohydrate kinase family protein [Pirellulales bacterium]|nr:carbohydrate kinase family protein [Pirellulales bacterium]
MSLDCLSVGILVADHLCSPIARMPGAGELEMCERLSLSIGGCASNVAMNLARVGVKVGVVGCVGRDLFGRFVIETLQAAGVETSGVRELDGVETSGTLIINVKGEDRRFIHTAGANAVMSAADIPIERVRRAKVLYVGGYLLMPAMESSLGLAAVFRQSQQAGVKTVLDVVVPAPGDHWPKLEHVLPHTDVFLPNDHESAMITGHSEPLAQAEKFRSAGARTVVITQGERGTLLVSDRQRIKASVYPTRFVGGTGSGDAFDAGYIAGMLAGEDEIGCLHWGSALGASCVRSVGATDSVFTREEALAFMEQHDLKIERC